MDAAVRVGFAELLLTELHHLHRPPLPVPAGQTGFIDVEIAAARELGLRFQPTRGSMSRGQSQGGLPPDECCQDEATILADCLRLIR